MNQRSETYIRVLERRIAKLQELFPKWISVEDALPDDKQKLIAINKRGGMILMEYSIQTLSILFPKDYTHWMPLPDPPNICTE